MLISVCESVKRNKYFLLLLFTAIVTYYNCFNQFQGIDLMEEILFVETNFEIMEQNDERLIRYVRSRYITPPSKLPLNLKKKNYQRDELGQWRSGTFLKVGANDGESSNTIELEVELGWTGLLIEWNLKVTPHLINVHRNAWVAEVCLSLTNYPGKLNLFVPETWDYSARLGPAWDLSKFGVNSSWIYFDGTVSVALYTIIAAVGYTEFDFLSLDIEGSEFEVLKNFPFENIMIKVFCDMETAGGGRTLFQRREEVQGRFETFYRDFKSYENGFGQLKYSFWLGLKHIHALTGGRDQSVQFDLTNWTGQKKYANYAVFYVGPAPFYNLGIQDYTGTAGDTLANDSPNGVSFTTYDRDYDAWPHNCAVNENLYTGGFWYRACGSAYLNTVYGRNGSSNGLRWLTFSTNLMRSEIKVRNKNFPNGCAPRKTNATLI